MTDQTARTILQYENKGVSEAIAGVDKIAAAEAQLAENARIAREEARKAQAELIEGNRLELEQRQQYAQRRAQYDQQRIQSTQQVANTQRIAVEIEQRQIPVIKQLSFQARMFGTELDNAGTTGNQRVAALEARFAGVRDEIATTSARVREFKRDLLSVGEETPTASVGATTASTVGTGERRTTASRRAGRGAIINVAASALSQAGLGEAGTTINIIDDLSRSLGTLGPIGAVAAGAVAGLAIGIQLLNKQLEGAKRALTAALNAQQTYYRALETQTSDQVQQQITNLRRQRQIIGQQLFETQVALISGFQQTTDVFGDASARVKDALGLTPYQELQKRFEELALQASQTDQEIARYTQGLQDNAFAANDARIALEQLTDKLEGEITLLGQAAGDTVRFANQISRVSRSELRGMLLDREQEKQALIASREAVEPWIEASEQARREYDNYTNQLDQVNSEIFALTDELAKTARAPDLWDSVTGFFKGAVDGVADVIDRIKKAGEINQRIAEIRGKGFEDLAKIELDLQERILTIQQDGADRRADILRDAQQSEEKSQRDYLRQRERIERDSNRAILSAIGRRDVLAFVEAQRNRSDQLDDLNKSITEERRVRQQATDERLRDLQRNEQKQIDAARRSASLQIAAVNDRVNKEVYAQQILLQQVFGFTQQRVDIETSGYQAIISAATSAFQQIWTAIPRLTTGGTGSGSGGGGSGSARYSTNYTINGRSVSVEEYLRAARNSLEISGRGR